MNKEVISIFWFRRDLRLDDNVALYHALSSGKMVLPIFIFDELIIKELSNNDPRVGFIYDSLHEINQELKKIGASLLIKKGTPIDVWKELLTEFKVESIFFNKDYEPYALKRDEEIKTICKSFNAEVFTFKDQVIFEENEVLKNDGLPYTVYTPYKNKWLLHYQDSNQFINESEKLTDNFIKKDFTFPRLKQIGIVPNSIKVIPYDLTVIKQYADNRDFPAISTSNLAPYLRFGLVSIRKLVKWAIKTDQVFCSELIWREFFMQILFHFPKVVTDNFKPKYNFVKWRNNEVEFDAWCNGKTGYPIVDAGMRQLNKTGYMHNRVRMVVASFLCKHLLIDWRWGEAYFAEKLLDYELSSNNGNWQWVAGTGCDAAPYFRVFNPITQEQKFDKNQEYIKRWIPNFESYNIKPIVEHKFARERFLSTFKEGIAQFTP
ncbi:cryptochrome/photolyase family protein [Urechidicola croceus]|uniref:Deoxyribodipyrimidine photolyase n=1 Tax=Urechidicola croceus TaxID=1850246 RepID=A0A1D8P3Q4_9FLAO|nr:deoxyribodipyrimidine photo-lyase [Urechidicola croceus]AOW19207.1 deoxyribodipyrimidine photolyase [Urechidicola croceus]